jgi:DNA-binding FadR family transcriptional regulator
MSGHVITAIRRRRLYQDVLQKITSLVQAGEVLVGDAFPPERELALKYDVSIAIVREAFRVLEHHGVVQGKQGGRRYLVRSAPSFGGLMTELEVVVTQDLLEARRAVEGAIVRVAAERSKESDIEALTELLEREPSFTDNEAFRVEDMEFHLAVAKATGNSVLRRLQEYINGLRAARVSFTMSVLTRHDLRRHHAPLVHALAAHDPDAAAAALSAHLDISQAAFEASPEFAQERVPTPADER